MEVGDALASHGSDLMREMELEKATEMKSLPKDTSCETKWVGMVGSGQPFESIESMGTGATSTKKEFKKLPSSRLVFWL